MDLGQFRAREAGTGFDIAKRSSRAFEKMKALRALTGAGPFGASEIFRLRQPPLKMTDRA
jgi:hypothetical protein